MIQSYCDCQKLALALQAANGEIHCLVKLSGPGHIDVMCETDVLAGGQGLIDAILWSTDVAPDNAIDPSLLA
ncbi:hypothetical protein PX699_16720 [Sphingobium sp. H39-3-25]|uniref:hypothetical protein n=1 Tax=Sphingomonadales TaxID=204457 RepID=UPI0008323035|nr:MULTISPECIES: hypothetical protein [Sphingomonadaceae]MDF0491568.1 hypothetical protein [Sphingomonas pollutisoli]MDF0543997.1 hypothetical protein [Sphingobium arseniciresistens]